MNNYLKNFPMENSDKTPHEKTKKDSFWERFNEAKAGKGKKENQDKGSLVEAIVKQTEREVGTEKKSFREEHQESFQAENEQKENAQKLFGFAKTLFVILVILSLGIWIYFYALLDSGNYFHSKFGKQNLTTQVNYKAELSRQLNTDLIATKKYNKLLTIENIANQIIAIDINSPTLNYERPEGETVIQKDQGAAIPLFRTINEQGQIEYYSEKDIVTAEEIQGKEAGDIKLALAEVQKALTDLDTETTIAPELEKDLKEITEGIKRVDLKEQNFPSPATKEYFRTAKYKAQKLLVKLKEVNLENLVEDIKKQSNAIDISTSSEKTQQVILQLREILQKISAQKASSFETALKEVAGLKLADLDPAVALKIAAIIGDPQNPEQSGDLQTAATIAKNLVKINTINRLKTEIYAWTNIIDNVEKIARLGADLEKDVGSTSAPAADIDPRGQYVDFVSYSGKAKDGLVEIRGEASAKGEYENIGFTLLANLIDAFEASKSFSNVEGYAFSKNQDRDGNIFVPLNFKFNIQNPGITDSRDFERIPRAN